MLAVTRTMQLLNALSSSEELGVIDLSHSLGIHKADVSRILSALEAMKYIGRNPDTGKYRIEFKFIAMSLRYRDRVRIEEIVHPVLVDLVKVTGELVQLAIEEQEQLIYVSKVEGVKPLRVASMLGQVAPLHATAAGKAWLASLPKDKVLSLFEERGMQAITEHTITDPLTLLRELEEIREQGYALSIEEVNKSIVGLAVPVYSGSQKVKAALVVAIPVFEATPERLEEIRQATVTAAKLLSERFSVF